MFGDVPTDCLLRLISAGVREAVRTEDSAAFLAWMRAEAPRRFGDVFDRFPAEISGRMALWLGAAIWNVTPLPGNEFRPRPLPQPQRNQPCICGSGRKLKHCCGERPPLPRIPAEIAWEAMVEAVPMARLRAAAAAGDLQAPQLGRVAARLLDLGKPRQALALVEPLFDRPELTDESCSMALDALFTALLMLGRQRQRERVVERLTRELRPPLRARAWARRATMLVDEGRHDEAWSAWERAHQDDPGGEDLAQLEVTLLLARGSLDQAAERARFHLGKLRRHGRADMELPALLEAVALDPLAAALQITAASAWSAALRLAEVAAGAVVQPVEARYTVAPDPDDPTAGTLTADADMVRLERRWRKVFPRDAAGLAGAVWDDDVALQWLEFLEANEAALDSLEVLFDLAVFAPDALGGLGAALLSSRLEPLVHRGAVIFDRLLADRPLLTLTPGKPVHDAAAAVLSAGLGRVADAAAAGSDGGLAVLERLERVVRLIPDAPLARETLVISYLKRGADRQALEAARSGASSQGGILDLCNVLALYRLGRKGEALAMLARAAAEWPDEAHRLVHGDPRPAARRRAKPGATVAGSPYDLLRALWRAEPELDLWLRERAAKGRSRSWRSAAAAAGGKGGSKIPRPPTGEARRPAAGPRAARRRPAVRGTESAPPEGAGHARLRLKVTLDGTRPPVWRRLEVAATQTLALFHHVLQAAMGWTDSHLHVFIAGRERFADPALKLDRSMRSERRTTIGELLRRRGDRLDYDYDFGDGWHHRIVLEEVLPARPDAPAAICLGGRRRCPPEDCGGVGGYAELLALLQGGDSPRRREMVEWLGSEIDPAAFDLEEAHRRLSQIA